MADKAEKNTLKTNPEKVLKNRRKFLKVIIAAALFFAACSVDEENYTLLHNYFYTVSFDTQIDTQKGSDCTPMSKKSGEEIILPSVSKSGYTFDGWYTAGIGGALAGKSGDSYVLTGDIILYAHWLQKISFDAQGGESCADKIAQFGKSITLPYTSRNNYIFDGWYTMSSGGKKIGAADDKPVFVDGDMTLYAHWLQRISFDVQGGTPCSTMTSASGASITLPTTTKANYTFDGWYTAVSGGEKAGGAGASYTGSGNTTLFARWIPNTYTISFDVSGGSAVANKEAKYGESITLPNTTKEGFVFQGWYNAGGVKAGDAFALYTIAGDAVLYARWGV